MKRGIVLALIGLVPSVPASTAHATMRLDLVRAAHCGTACPIDALGRGVFEISGSRKQGANGVVGHIRIRGASKDGKKVDLENLLVILPLEHGDGVCTANVLPGLEISRGKASLRFTGTDVGVSEPPGTVLALCGEVRIQPANANGYAPILTAGFVLSARPKGVLRMDLVRAPRCSVNCPIDQVGRARLELSDRGPKRGGGLAVKVDLSGIRKDGGKVELDALRADFGFSPDDSPICWAAAVFDVAIRKGRTVHRATGQDVLTTMPQMPGMTLSFCSGATIGRDGVEDDPLLTAGIIVGEGPD